HRRMGEREFRRATRDLPLVATLGASAPCRGAGADAGPGGVAASRGRLAHGVGGRPARPRHRAPRGRTARLALRRNAADGASALLPSSPPAARGEGCLPGPWEGPPPPAGLLGAAPGAAPAAGERAELEPAARAAPDEPLPRVLLADLETDPDRRLARAEELRKA